MSGTYRALAPAKINLGLFLGPTRAADGKHELVSVMQSISLADELTLEPAPPGTDSDEVLCPGVDGAPGENLAARALEAFRARTGWDGPPQRLSIVKRIPVAAGLGGGSADAAASLRLAREASGLGNQRLLLEIAAELGADVPAQIAPGRWLATGAGEQLQALPAPRAPFGVLVLPSSSALSTGEVYREADRLGLSRPAEELEIRRVELYEGLEHGEVLPAATELLHNDLQRAAVSLQPDLLEALRRARGMGAEVELLSGSGPTVLGLFRKAEQAQHAARALEGLAPAAVYATPVEAAFGLPRASQSPTVNL
jgi:4-diphosphocytidyl-2-C-methyl-D-erythritol kinase